MIMTWVAWSAFIWMDHRSNESITIGFVLAVLLVSVTPLINIMASTGFTLLWLIEIQVFDKIGKFCAIPVYTFGENKRKP